MLITVILMAVGTLGTVPKNLKKRAVTRYQRKNRDSVLLKSVWILGRVLET